MRNLSEINPNRPLTNAGAALSEQSAPFKASEMAKFVRLVLAKPENFPGLKSNPPERKVKDTCSPLCVLLQDTFLSSSGHQGCGHPSHDVARCHP